MRFAASAQVSPRKGAGPEQLRLRAVPPSNLSLLGLVRHMAEAERHWFQNVVRGADRELPWGTLGDQAFNVDYADADEAFELWQAECAQSRAIVDAVESLDTTGHHPVGALSLRWIITHMIEDYARHNGHADLLRECIDGTTGE
jgi:hypothetical protein